MTDSNDLLLPGPQRYDCPCEPSCGLFGVLKGKRGHVRGCTCRRCTGGRSRRTGMSDQRAFQKAAGIVESDWRGANGNEESWRDPFRWEHKAGAQVRPAVTAYVKALKQLEQNRPIGDHRPPAVGLSVDGTQLVCIDAETWRTVIVPLLEALS